MVTKKSAKKSAAAKKPAAKATKRKTASAAKSAKQAVKTAGSAQGAAKSAKKPAKRAASAAKRSASKAGGQASGLRVRMYRVGFGDFFLLTVPTKTGPQHILIDCGVHAGDIKSMDACVQDLIKETDRKLALVIATHYHADHLSGFASNFDEFSEFEVGMVWITNRLDPDHARASKFKAQIRSLSHQLQMRLGARSDPAGAQAQAKVQNALGVQLGAAGKEGSNDKALRLLRSGFKNKHPVLYYQGGDIAELPPALKGALTAELLGPAPIDDASDFKTTDNKLEQYLGAAADGGLPPSETLTPFQNQWPATSANYPNAIFNGYRAPTQTQAQANADPSASIKRMEATLKSVQPDALLALADAIDGTLNNQSLVVLFTCAGKKLLFVGDAQWGNWSFWLYGKKVTGKDPGILPKAKEILGSIDFYKVGHHGSTNANPIPAVAALSPDCVSMCSTEAGDEKPGDPVKNRPYGKIASKTEVPRILLMEELEKQTNNQLVRSDWIDVPSAKASPEAKSQLAALPANFIQGDLYVDYVFPA
jgi:beta-lactamase superfamily II metal-dependent hydrolase